MSEHVFAVDLEAPAELHVRSRDDLLELRIAPKERLLPEVAAVEVEQIKRHQDDLVRAALEFFLQHRKIGRAVRGGHDDLAVDDGRCRLDVPRVVGDFLEAVGPVVSAAGEDIYGFVRPVHLHAVAVELDLVNPPLSLGTRSIEDASAGSMNPGNGVLRPMIAGFARGNATYQLHANKRFKLAPFESFRNSGILAALGL